MPQIYNEEFRKNIVRLHLQEGRTYKSLIDEFGVSKASISKWCTDVFYNHVRPHSFNDNLTPFQKRLV